MMSEILSKRLYIGGLSESVSESELLERFSRFGNVSDVSLKTRVDENGAPLKSFAHLNLQSDEASIKKCFNTYQNAKWKGSVMKLQYAKESILERLQKEREENALAEAKLSKPQAEKSSTPEIVTTAKGVPGTPVPGKKDWVVGKYGRAVPVMKLKKSYKVPMVKHDPSKYCHTAKVFKDEVQDSTLGNSCTKLTWEINKPDSEITKKRKGEYPENSQPLKKKTVGSLDSGGKSEKNSLFSFSEDLKNKQKAFLPSHRDDDLEFVKIGAVTKRPRVLSSADTSNKFDSDIESEPEAMSPSVAKQKNSVTGPLGKPKTSKEPSESGPKKSQQIQTKPTEPENGRKDLSKSLTTKQNQANDSFSYNRLGIPEFKGLSMLAGLVQPTAVSENKGTDKIVSTKLAQVSTSEEEKPKLAKASLPNGHFNSKLRSSNKKSLEPDANSFTESSIIANRVQDITIATPAPFSSRGEDYSFKTSTPNVPSEPVNKDTTQMSDESKSFKLIPEFKGLGMLSDYKVDDNKKSSDLKSPQKLESDTAIIESVSQSKESPLLSGIKLQQQQENPKTLKSPKDIRLSLNNKENSKKRKVPTGRGDQASNSDSDSSANTDEIIVRHKKQKTSDSVVLSKPEPVVAQSEIKSKGEVSVDRNSVMSEFISGVDEFDACPSAAPARKVSEDDSYDSDLDSNDFALVAKKLRQKAFLSKQGGVQKLNSNDKKRKDSSTQREPLSSARETKELAKSHMTDLQSKLVKIAGTEKEPTGESGNVKQEKIKHLSEKEKHKAANEKRLEAVKQQAKQRQQQQQLMQQALRSVDSQENNKKRIVFDSSDDDNENEDRPKDNVPLATEKISNPAEGKNQEISGPSLFASSDDDESDEDNFDEMFKSKPQFEGKKGEKLLKLENRIADKRFTLDAKFADSDSDEEEDNDKDQAEASDASEDAGRDTKVSADADLTSKLKEEKSSNLKVLEDVVGKSTLDRFSDKISRNTKKIIDMNSVRFDPTKMNVSSAPPKTKKKKEKAEKVAAPPAASKEQQGETPESKDVKKEKKKSKKTEDGEVAEVATPNKVDSDEDPSKDEAESKDKSTKQKEEKSVSKIDDPDSKKKTNVELSSTLLDMFKTKAEQKEDKGATFSLTQQFGEADSDEDSVEQDGEDRAKGSGLSQVEKDKSMTKSAAETKRDAVSEKKKNEEGEEKDAVGRDQEMPSDSDLSSDEGEKEEDVEESKKSTSSSKVKPRNGIDDDLQEAGKLDIRFTSEKWLEQWDALRQNIIKIYKKKHKDALKKKRIHGETKRKKEFLKNSRKPGKKQGAFKKR
ncbi:hypothetical protein EGW08_003468 [Elysia chlorotica]|uniref:RRM domain-containing protein n=1 Tax=Elysia chlorotica TaxID=188477 RepID=A0A3S1BQ29_ELYCH|nr:hypothetical protein EGW08_003468 [Elysia chlorotica]